MGAAVETKQMKKSPKLPFRNESVKGDRLRTYLRTKKDVHRAMIEKLAESLLTAEDARKLRFKPFTAAEVVQAFPRLPVYRAGFQMPYWDLKGKPSGFFRFRYLEYGIEMGFAAQTVANAKKLLRYGQETGTTNELYLPP
jgi:hypothetical protein